MNRTGRILSLIVIFIIAASTLAFAAGTPGGLKFSDKEESYPAEGSKGAAIENFGIKLYFEGTLTQKELKEKNHDCFKLTDDEGNNLPVLVLYAPKEEGVVMVLFDSEKKNLDKDGKQIKIKGDTEYTLTISGDFQDDEGNTLGSPKTIKFTTINQSRNTVINMLLMLVMYVGIIVFGMRGAKKKAQEQAAEAKVNPYKQSKKTGKSVEEIVEKDRNRKQKAAEKAAKLAAEDEYDEEYLEEGHYRVHRIRTVASGGSSYITGRKAEAEKRAALEEKWAKAKRKKR